MKSAKEVTIDYLKSIINEKRNIEEKKISELR